MLILNEAKWTYVTTMAENDELSQMEHTIFLRKANENDICVQYSFSQSENTSEFLQDKVKTPGIIVFTSSLTNIGEKLETLPPKHGVLIISHDRSELTLNMTNKILVLNDGFPQNNFSNYILDQLSNNEKISVSLRNYFVSRHNCSWNATADELSCATPSAVVDHFSTRSSEFDINTALHAIDVLIVASENGSSRNELLDDSLVSLTSLQNWNIHKVI